jgi:hypothetical protein
LELKILSGDFFRGCVGPEHRGWRIREAFN